MDIAICVMYMVNFQCPWPHIISNNILKYIYKADAVCTWEVMALLHFDNLVHHAQSYILHHLLHQLWMQLAVDGTDQTYTCTKQLMRKQR